MRNNILRPVGGSKRRPGTRFIAAAKATDKAPLLVGYTPRAGTDYILEWGESGGAGYLRFFTRNGQILTDASEKITNGGFPTNLAGWTLGGTTQWSSFNGGCMELLAKFDNGRQSATVLAGTVYAVRFQLFGPPGQFVNVRVGTADGLSDILIVSLLPGSYTYMLASSTTTMAIRFGNQTGVSAPQQVDNVSIAQASAAFEIATPYLAVNLPNLRWAPSADVIYLACEGFAPRKLVRLSDTSWTLSIAKFRPPPTEEKPIFPAADITLSALTGDAITITASAAVFLDADVGRQITAGAGRAVITGFTSTTVLTADVLDDFAASPITSGNWAMTGSPNSVAQPGKKGPVGAQVTLVQNTPTNAFRVADVGKYIRIQNGVIRITAFVNAFTVKGEILHVMESVSPTTDWTLEAESWNATDGWPVDVAFSSGDRLVWLRKDRAWLSVVGDYEKYSETTLDDDALQVRLRTADVCQGRWIAGATELIIGTSAAEFVITGGNTGPITPTNFTISSDTTFGAALGRAIRVGLAVLFLDRSARGLREFLPDYLTQKFNAQDLLQLAQHLAPVGRTIVGLAYQRAPDSIVWATRSDGTLLGLTYNAPEKVIGWHRHDTENGAGAFVSTAVIPHPNGDRDQVWHAVRRVVNGATVHYIETFDDTSIFTDRNGVTYGAAGLDSSLTYSGPATSTLTGLGHLEAKAVRVIADGAPLPGTFTVTGGSLTLPAAASLIEVGLMFDSTLIPMRPEIPVTGTSQGLPKTLGPIVVRLYQSLGCTVQGEAVPFRTVDDPMDQPPALFDGDKEVSAQGWDTDGFITIEQLEPLPCEVLGVFAVVAVGG